MLVVEADVEAGAGASGNDVAGRVADIGGGHFQVGRLEVLVAVVQLHRGEGRQHFAKLGHWIVGPVRIGDVALYAGDGDPYIDRAATADLDDVSQPGFRGRLADQDHVGPDPAL